MMELCCGMGYQTENRKGGLEGISFHDFIFIFCMQTYLFCFRLFYFIFSELAVLHPRLNILMTSLSLSLFEMVQNERVTGALDHLFFTKSQIFFEQKPNTIKPLTKFKINSTQSVRRNYVLVQLHFKKHPGECTAVINEMYMQKVKLKRSCIIT